MAEANSDEVEKNRELYRNLYSDFFTIKTDRTEPLLLAHYTSIPIAEEILKNDQLWFSNPLYMNDLGEMNTWN